MSISWDSRFDGTYPEPFQQRYRDLGEAIYDDYPNRDPLFLKPRAGRAEDFGGIWSAGEAFIAWAHGNLTGGGFPNGGGSWGDPFEYSYDAEDQCRALRSLGCRADRDKMCKEFNLRKGGEQGFAVGNTIFQISQCDPSLREEQEPFVWGSDGSICIYDRYNFEDEEDFTLSAPGPFQILSVFAAGVGCGIAALNDSPIGDWRDAWFNYQSISPNRNREPYLRWNDPDNPVKKTCPGKSRYMYTKACFDAERVKECNPELFYDALGRGVFNYSSIPGTLPVGDKQPSPYLGLPFQPPVSVDIVPAPDYFGFTYGDYSAPFNSWSQGTTNALYDLGPYAKLNKFWPGIEDTLCSIDDNNPPSGQKGEDDFKGKNKGENGLYGRIIIITSGANAGELGFILQDWYHFDDEPYNTSNGTASGERYPSKAEWWEGAVKSPMTVRFVNLSSQPYVDVQVAASAPIPTNPNFFPGPNLSAYNDLSYDMLLLMTSAAVVRSVFSGGWL